MSTVDLSEDIGALQAGPRAPAEQTPLLPPGAIRRTCHVDVGPRGDAGWGERGVALEVRGAVRDVRADGPVPTLLDEACLVADLDADRRVERVVLEPAADTSELIGSPVGGGFRSGALAVVDDPSSPRGVLLRDLPTAVVILAGYAHLRTLQRRGLGATMTPPAVLPSMADVCSGWRSGGVMTSSIARGDGVPLQDCPPAPDLGDGWHDLGELPPAWVRRRRRIDLIPSRGGFRVDAMFRDSYAAPDQREQVLHEYGLTADLDDGLVLTRVVAHPRVLPFTECPWAAASVERLAGTPAAEARAGVAEHLSGTAGCTHLNDLVAALADLPSLKP